SAAGSGKTAVLIERIMQLLLEESLSLDQLLVVTFTKAAANQMRERLGQALEKNIRLYPQKNCLQLQKAFLPQAAICTLHSFCLDLVRRYFYLVDLDPDFRIGDSNEILLLRQEVLEELLESCYEQAEPDFMQLADAWGGERNDQPLMELIEQIYDFARSNPHWKDWLEQKLTQLQMDSQQNLDQLAWVQDLKQSLQQEIQGAIQLLQKAEKINTHWLASSAYSQALQQEIQQLEGLSRQFDAEWNKLSQKFQQIHFGRFPNKPKEATENYCEQIKALRKQAKEILDKIQKNYFTREASQHSADLAKTIPWLQVLVKLVEQFEQLFQKEKKARNLLDFNDLEHYALQLLERPEVQPDFQEVLVDEYQDINPLQDQILNLLAAAGHLFMVGDMKQSIYRFRQADPFLFQSKYSSNSDSWLKINLNANFRSRREIINGVNELFFRLMQKDCGEIVYDSEAALKYGANYPEESVGETYAPEWHLLEKQPDSEEDFEKDAIRAEAIVVAERIVQLRTEGFQVYEANIGYRPLEYRDIVILMRSLTDWTGIFLEELAKRNLPAYADRAGGYYDTVEIEVILALLQIIDNPRQDIPLAAVMRSPLFGFDEDELLALSLNRQQKKLWEMIMEAESL
ncbi:MAG: UvrD-helicase domain-containing protein, partial [Clostridia bacterium]|nr:UvrD-helicase domain-containing protein [Clostridia bacterium]